MKIILAHYKYYIQGGPESYMFKFIELAQSYGHEVIPFTVDYEKNQPSQYKEFFVSTADQTGFYKTGNRNIKYLLQGVCREFANREAYTKLKKLIKQEHPDVIYTLIPGELSADIFKAAKEEKLPIILRISDFRLLCGCNVLLRENAVCEECIHGKYTSMIKHRCVKGSLALSILRAVSLTYARWRKRYDCVDAIITPTAFTKEKFVESGYFQREKVHVNPTFIDCNKYQPRYSHDNYVLCLGRFSKEKGFIYVVKALQYLMDLDIKIAVTGDKDNCDQELKQVIAECGLEDKIKFVGFLHGKELEEITANAMCVACPAIWYENLPNVILESYAYGKPVIASRLGSLADAVEDGKTGLLFEPKNVEQIADCIRKLYEDPVLCEELGRNARKAAEEKYSPEAHWDTFEKIYEQIKNT